ncbi:MAG: hypothetical protein AUG49_25250 [Catenulispora sp. 13_1_20CM_3_70_7]|nr:MAG: hypothetical protein AUG49_25250 [Catenulispora sp. 13_1_20CM_3_70_7]
MVTPPDPAGLLELGLAVFALPPGDRRPGPGWHDATITDAQQLAERWRPGDNIGVPCRPNRLVVLDLDRKNGVDGVAALAAAAAKAGGGIPHTLVVATPNGGRHLYYRLPPGRIIGSTSAGTSGLGPGIDTRGPGRRFGGYVVGPDSLVDDRRYTIADAAPIAQLPAWIADILAARTAAALRVKVRQAS